jgi:plasmid stabilization system protein ParE
MPTSKDPKKRAIQLANLRPAPPAPVGNDRPRTHGAYAAIAAERLDAKARAVFDALAADAPVRDGGALPAADGVAVRLLADTLCRLDDVAEYLARRGWADAKGNPRAALHVETRLRSQAAELLDRLGMTPTARARLGLDLVRAGQALDLAAHWAAQDGGNG